MSKQPGTWPRRLTGSGLLGCSLIGGAITQSVGAAAAARHGGSSSRTSIAVLPGSGSVALLAIINRDRARYGLPKLRLRPVQSRGTGSCVGSFGHSEAMARSGTIWHTNLRFRRASFPNSICTHFMHVGENVGKSSTGSVMRDLEVLNRLMLAEPHSKTVCAATVNHACTILSPVFHHVGIGVYHVNGSTWVTEDFTN